MFAIELNSGIPIYRQVFNQLVRQIAHGLLQKGDMLPSVRQLAGELGINPMTVSKAYGLLESEGIVERKRGVGMIIIKKAESPGDVLKSSVRELVQDAKDLGFNESQLKQLIQKQWRRK